MKLRIASCSGAAVLALVLLAPAAQAQVGRYNQDDVRAHHKQDKAGTEDAAKAGEKYPNATRESPHLEATKAGGKVLKELVDLLQAKNYPEAIAKSDALLATTQNQYERAFAAQVAANAAAESGDDAKAEVYFKQAVDADGLDNNDHYAALFNLAVTQYRLKHFADALASLDRLTAETKADPMENAALRASLLANLDRPAEAAALYEQLYQHDPNNGTALNNAVALYQQGGNADKANALLTAAKGKGQLNDPAAYRALYVGYINAGKLDDAVRTIDEGLAKGIVPKDKDLVDVYSVIAQTAYGNGDSKTAIAMYGRAADIAADGEPRLNQAKVLLNEGQVAAAKKAAQQALDKGLKNPGDAKRILAAGGK